MVEEGFIEVPLRLAGCDEVGRGPLAGPVVGACALLGIVSEPQRARDFLLGLRQGGVDDSKKLSAARRRTLVRQLGCRDLRVGHNPVLVLERNPFFSLGVAIVGVSHRVVDEINILRASLLAMGRSFAKLDDGSPSVLFIDGKTPLDRHWKHVRQVPLVGGDSKSVLVALASIFAKEYRDSLMGRYAERYPRYGFESHAGYPTKRHREAIARYGATDIHRKTFKGVREFL